MKLNKTWIAWIGLLMFPVIATAKESNDLFRVAAGVELGRLAIEVAGEVETAGKVDFTRLPRSEVVVREAVLGAGPGEFCGAWRYEGVALMDILRDWKLKKANAKEFNLPLDLGVIVESRSGERVVIGWGELFYATSARRIVIADRVAPIYPHKVKVEWKVPAAPRLICADDLLSERNIEHPVRLIVFSAKRQFVVNRNLKPLFADQILLHAGERRVGTIDATPRSVEKRTYPTFWYGRGTGFHGYQDFSGEMLGQILKKHFPTSRENLRRGYFLLSGVDGYRILVTYSELCNRADQADWMLLDKGAGSDGGRFTLFPPADFFSDRAVKAVSVIHLETL